MTKSGTADRYGTKHFGTDRKLYQCVSGNLGIDIQGVQKYIEKGIFGRNLSDRMLKRKAKPAKGDEENGQIISIEAEFAFEAILSREGEIDPLLQEHSSHTNLHHQHA